MKLYTFVVHYLQMCMKEYGCCPKFRREDNSTYTFTKRGVMYLVSATPTKLLIEFLSIFLHAHLQVVSYKCVKFHKNPTSGLGVVLTSYTTPLFVKV
jgi:hypothetical protein